MHSGVCLQDYLFVRGVGRMAGALAGVAPEAHLDTLLSGIGGFLHTNTCVFTLGTVSWCVCVDGKYSWEFMGVHLLLMASSQHPSWH